MGPHISDMNLYRNLYPGDILKVKRPFTLRLGDNSQLYVPRDQMIFVISRVDLYRTDFDDYAQGRFFYLTDGTFYHILNYLYDSYSSIIEKI